MPRENYYPLYLTSNFISKFSSSLIHAGYISLCITKTLKRCMHSSSNLGCILLFWLVLYIFRQSPCDLLVQKLGETSKACHSRGKGSVACSRCIQGWSCPQLYFLIDTGCGQHQNLLVTWYIVTTTKTETT